MSALAGFLDALWPRRCAASGCGERVDRPGRALCSSCRSRLAFIDGARCSVCGTPAAADEPGAFVCEECIAHPPAFDAARAAARHEGAARDLVVDFKFRARFELKEDLVDLIEGALNAGFDRGAVDMIVPVPLHPFRRLTRGFNQSELLAEALGERIDRRVDARALRRVRDTVHQSRLGGSARRRNLAGAFELGRPESIAGRTVLLVDDVMTTGATLDACSAVLRAGGARRILCLTATRR